MTTGIERQIFHTAPTKIFGTFGLSRFLKRRRREQSTTNKYNENDVASHRYTFDHAERTIDRAVTPITSAGFKPLPSLQRRRNIETGFTR